MKIHNNIHISLLEPYEDNKFPSQQLIPPPPIEITGEKEYELEEIIDSRLHYGKLQYRAKWTGYSPEHDILLCAFCPALISSASRVSSILLSS